MGLQPLCALAAWPPGASKRCSNRPHSPKPEPKRKSSLPGCADWSLVAVVGCDCVHVHAHVHYVHILRLPRLPVCVLSVCVNCC